LLAASLPPFVREFGFELALCARLESVRDDLVSRQLGAHVEGRRILDTVLVAPGPDFDARAAITPHRIPGPAIESDAGPGTARPITDAFDCHPDRARSIAEHAVDLGFFERTRNGGRDCVRQTTRYPEAWFDRIVGIENKPDLGRPGDLQRQLRTDVSLGLLDAVVLATESYVTGAHLNRIPDAVGVWRFDPETGNREVIRDPEPLGTGEAGIEPVEKRPAETRVHVATPAEKERARRRLAERAYGKGWRTYDLPACAHASTGDCFGSGGLPDCAWKGRLVDPGSECGPACDGYEPADPPAFDDESERASHQPWEPDPDGVARQQSGLDQFR
jgi:hypothetical protein